VIVSRRAAKDTEVFGVTIKAGDTVCCSMTLASRDEKEFANANQLDISQPPRRHMGFGFGPHTCVGMHLARLEANVVLERWLARIPKFKIVSGAPVPSHGGAVIGLDALPLTWA
jgi:cytochrome P450